MDGFLPPTLIKGGQYRIYLTEKIFFGNNWVHVWALHLLFSIHSPASKCRVVQSYPAGTAWWPAHLSCSSWAFSRVRMTRSDLCRDAVNSEICVLKELVPVSVMLFCSEWNTWCWLVVFCLLRWLSPFSLDYEGQIARLVFVEVDRQATTYQKTPTLTNWRQG